MANPQVATGSHFNQWEASKTQESHRGAGMPQGSPLSPLLSNVLLDLLDKHLKSKGYRFIRYADDFSIYAKTKEEARKIGNETYLFLKDKLDLPINREKSHRGAAVYADQQTLRY